LNGRNLQVIELLERETRLELATSTLARSIRGLLAVRSYP